MTEPETRHGRRSGPGLRRNAVLIARREYLDRVPTRTFLAATLVLAAVAIGLALAPIALRYLDRGTVVRIGVVAPDDDVANVSLALLDGYLNTAPQGVDPAAWEKPFALVREPDERTAMLGLSARRLTSVLVIERAADGGLGFTFHTPESAASALSQRVGFGSVGVGILDWQAKLPTDPGIGQFHQPAYSVVSTSAPVEQDRGSTRS